MKWRVVKPAVNQDTGERLRVGDVVELSAAEYSRLQAFGAIVPHVEDTVERAVVAPSESRIITYRRRGRRR